MWKSILAVAVASWEELKSHLRIVHKTSLIVVEWFCFCCGDFTRFSFEGMQ